MCGFCIKSEEMGRAFLLQAKLEGVEGRSHPPGPHRQTHLVGVEKLVAWLMQPGHNPPPDPDPVGLTPAPAPARAPCYAGPGKKKKKATKKGATADVEGGTTTTRWKANHQLVRMLHAIVENKDTFLRRHQRPASRDELEAGDRKSCWVHIAQTVENRVSALARATAVYI